MKQIGKLALVSNSDVSIMVEGPSDLKSNHTLVDEEEDFLLELARTSSKVVPGVDEPQESLGASEESEQDDSELEERRARELAAKEKRDKERQKKVKTFKRRRACINCLRKVVCFEDDQNNFDLETKIPSCRQVCCWRLLRARRHSHRFHASQESLLAFEKSKYQRFIGVLISVNYIILYTVLLYPFILIAQEKLFGEEEDDCVYGLSEQGHCLTEGETVPSEFNELKEEGLSFNEIMLIVNGGVLLYQLICELIMIAVQKDRARLSCCNQYLLIQVFNGVTLRAVILISAQLVAAFITQVGVLSYTIGIVLGVSLIFSQVRALQIFAVCIKLDLNCLLPNIERNYKLSMSTFFFGNAVIYKKLSAEPSVQANARYKEMVEENERLMSFSGDVDDQNRSRKTRLKDKLSCKICKFGSPKYWQMVLNDIPLLMAIPCAYILGLVDQITMVVALFMTLSDFISMVTYLLHDDELSIDSNQIYTQTLKRQEQHEQSIEKLQINSDDELVEGQTHLRKRSVHSEFQVDSQTHDFSHDMDTLKPNMGLKMNKAQNLITQSRQSGELQKNVYLEGEGDGRKHLLTSNRSMRETEQLDGNQFASIDMRPGRTRNADLLETAQSLQLRQNRGTFGQDIQLTEGANINLDTGGTETEKSFRITDALERGQLTDTISVKNARSEQLKEIFKYKIAEK